MNRELGASYEDAEARMSRRKAKHNVFYAHRSLLLLLYCEMLSAAPYAVKTARSGDLIALLLGSILFSRKSLPERSVRVRCFLISFMFYAL